MKTDYALRALFTLVEQQGRGPVPIREMAERNDVSKKYLEHIMLDLKGRGWVSSVPGIKGGYALARPAEEITLGAVVRHFEGVLAPIHCVSVNGYEPCSQERVCRFRRVMLEIRNYVANLMDAATLAQVFRGTPVTQTEVFEERFIGGTGI